MNIKEFVETYQFIDKEARKHLPVIASLQLSKREYDRVCIEDFKISDIDEEYVAYTAEYNDACGCHPEYQTATVHINWTTIDSVAS